MRTVIAFLFVIYVSYWFGSIKSEYYARQLDRCIYQSMTFDEENTREEDR